MNLRAASTARRELVAALVVLTLATLCCFHKLMLHPDEVLVGPQRFGHNDLTDYFLASREFAAQSVREGGLPFWNPHLCLGLPFTGNPQSALCYPPNWLTLAWSPRHSLCWLLVAHHLFAGMGVYCLSRRYGLSWSAAVLGGIVFLGAPFLILQSAEGHYPQICAVAWIPWAFLAYERFRDARTGIIGGSMTRSGSSAGVFLMTASLAACFFCGHAQETYYLVLLLTGCLIADATACKLNGGRGGAIALCRGWLQCGLFTFGIVAIDLIPTFLATLRTARPGLKQQGSGFSWTSLTLDSVHELIDPFALTRPELWEPGTTPLWEKLFHFGVFPLVLATIGIALGWSRKPVRRMTLLWIVTVLFAFGARGDAYDVLTGVVPGLGWFRLPSRILFFTSFATACLAAYGWDVVQRRATRLRQGARTCGLLSAIVILLCVAELTRFSHQVTDTATVRTLDQREPELAELLQDAGPAHRVLAPQSVVSDLDAVRLKIAKVSGYEPAGPMAYLAVHAELPGDTSTAPDPMGFLPSDPLRMDRHWLELLGVRYAVRSGRADNLPDGWRHAGTFELSPAVQRRAKPGELPTEQWQVLELQSTLPRTYAVGRAVPIGGFSEFAESLASRDLTKSVALASDVLPEGPRATFAGATIVNETPTQIDVQANLDAPGYLVMSDLWFPGWSAWIGDRELDVLPANGVFRAVPLPPGQHRVTLAYQPRGLVMGALLSAATLLLLVVRTRRSASVGRGSESREMRDADQTDPRFPPGGRHREAAAALSVGRQ